MPKFKATVDAAEAERGLLFFGRSMHSTLNKGMRELAREGELIMKNAAPERSGRLRDDIRVITEQGRAVVGNRGRFGTGISLAIVADPVSPKGFHYVGVSRFGHDVRYISARRGKYMKLPAGGGYGPRLLREVSGSNPDRDWAALGVRIIQNQAKTKTNEIGRRLELIGR